MYSVTQRIKSYNRNPGQPRGGLINPRMMSVTRLDDGVGPLGLEEENLPATIVGSAVDYLARLSLVRADAESLTQAAAQVFEISLKGAERISEQTGGASALDDALDALMELYFVECPDGTARFELNETAARVACRLASYDVGLRAGVGFYKPETTRTQPKAVTIEHILRMVARASSFFDEYGPITKSGFVFADDEQADLRSAHLLATGELIGAGGYTELVSSGDCDFLSEDTLWDFKVSVAKPTKDHTLQLLMYFLMGEESGLPEFRSLTHVGVFNPRMNAVYRLAVNDIPGEVIEAVRYEVIGYERPHHRIAA